MNKLFVDNWFKLPPKAGEQTYIIKIVPAGSGRRRARNGKPCKKAKK